MSQESLVAQGLYGVTARALTLGALSLIAPLCVGGATAWAQTTLCALVIISGLQLASARQRGRGVRLSSPINLWLAGPLLSLIGALLSLIPLRWLHPYLSPEGALTLDRLTDPLGAATLSAPLWGALSLAPIETISWVCLQVTFCLTAYLAYHLHPYRLRALTGIAIAGPALTIYGLIHETLGLTSIYGLYQSSDRKALLGFFTPIINQNSAASLMLLSALTALGLALAHKQQRAWMIAAALSLLGLWRTESRGALIAGGLSLTLLAALHPLKLSGVSARASRVISLISLCVSLTALTTAAWWAHTTHVAQERAQSWLTPTPYPRFIVWRDTLNIIQERWLSGIGRGAFGEVFTRYQSFSHRSWISHVESHLLEQLTEGGLIGLIGGALLPACAWLMWRWRARGEAHATATALWLGIGAVGLHQCLDFGLNQAGLALPLAIAWGVLWSYLNQAPTSSTLEERPQREERARRKRRAALTLSLTALSLAPLAALTLYTAPLRLRPSLSALALINDPDERAGRAKDLLGLHPTSAHITQQAAIGYATALRRWSLPNPSNTYNAHEEREPSQLTTYTDRLWTWTKATQRRAPRFSTPYIIEARGYAQEGLSELAALTYSHALNLAPWLLKSLIIEARAASPSPLDLTPLRADLIIPALEVLRRVSPQDALESLNRLPIEQRLKSSGLRAEQISLSRGDCAPASLSALREIEVISLDQAEPCALTLDRALAALLRVRCALPRVVSSLTKRSSADPSEGPLSDHVLLEVFAHPMSSNHSLDPALYESIHACAPAGQKHDPLAWFRFKERVTRRFLR